MENMRKKYKKQIGGGMIQACLVGVKCFRPLLNEVADVETTSELGR